MTLPESAFRDWVGVIHFYCAFKTIVIATVILRKGGSLLLAFTDIMVKQDCLFVNQKVGSA